MPFYKEHKYWNNNYRFSIEEYEQQFSINQDTCMLIDFVPIAFHDKTLLNKIIASNYFDIYILSYRNIADLLTSALTYREHTGVLKSYIVKMGDISYFSYREVHKAIPKEKLVWFDFEKFINDSSYLNLLLSNVSDINLELKSTGGIRNSPFEYRFKIIPWCLGVFKLLGLKVPRTEVFYRLRRLFIKPRKKIDMIYSAGVRQELNKEQEYLDYVRRISTFS